VLNARDSLLTRQVQKGKARVSATEVRDVSRRSSPHPLPEELMIPIRGRIGHDIFNRDDKRGLAPLQADAVQLTWPASGSADSSVRHILAEPRCRGEARAYPTGRDAGAAGSVLHVLPCYPNEANRLVELTGSNPSRK
jgi:hypothetical protein